jgi:hypothetical protein
MSVKSRVVGSSPVEDERRHPHRRKHVREVGFYERAVLDLR